VLFKFSCHSQAYINHLYYFNFRNFVLYLTSPYIMKKRSHNVVDLWNPRRLNKLLGSDLETFDKNLIKTFLEENKFLIDDCNSAKESAAIEQFSLEKIQENLTKLMKENASFDEVCNWITANVGSRVKDPEFIRLLMTAILETALERHHYTWKLNLNTFISLQTLIQRFVNANVLLELQCLYAIQKYIKKIEFPCNTLVPIMNQLWMDNVISSDAFLIWRKKQPEGADIEGHSISVVTLMSFFIRLEKLDDNSSTDKL